MATWLIKERPLLTKEITAIKTIEPRARERELKPGAKTLINCVNRLSTLTRKNEPKPYITSNRAKFAKLFLSVLLSINQ